MSEEHSPGPWRMSDTTYLVDANGETVTPLSPQAPWKHSTDRAKWSAIIDANVRLIAAAPELLEALRDAVKQLDPYSGHEGRPTIASHRAAREKYGAIIRLIEGGE